MRVERHKLEAHDEISFETEGEAFIHPLVGRGTATCESAIPMQLGGRRNIFDPFPNGMYLREDFQITATTDFDVIVAIDDGPFDWEIGEKVRAKIHMIGEGTARREVREILGHGGPSVRLRCGETVNKPGGWSSWPPHKFDHDETTTGFEEVFYVFTDPKDSYAIMTANGVPKLLRSGERTDVPLGSHPIVAAPGTRLIYCWFYVGATKEYARWSEDLGNYK